MESRYRVVVPFRAFFEVGLCHADADGRRTPAPVPRLEARNVPEGSFVMPWNYGIMVRRPGEELARAMLRIPRQTRPSHGQTSPRGIMLARMNQARLGKSDPVRRSDSERLRDMADAGLLRDLPPPNPRTDLVGYDYEPPMRMATRILPGMRGGVVEIEPSHELATLKDDIGDLVTHLERSGADRVVYEDIGSDDIVRIRAEFADGCVVVATRPETASTWLEGPLPEQADPLGRLAGLAPMGGMTRGDFLDAIRSAMESQPSPGR